MKGGAAGDFKRHRPSYQFPETAFIDSGLDEASAGARAAPPEASGWSNQRVASGFPVSMRLFSDDIISGQPSTEPL